MLVPSFLPPSQSLFLVHPGLLGGVRACDLEKIESSQIDVMDGSHSRIEYI